jgi:hypothetical protein
VGKSPLLFRFCCALVSDPAIRAQLDDPRASDATAPFQALNSQ